MRSEPAVVVWDTCVIIDAIQKTAGRYECIEPYIQDAEKGKLRIIISEVSVAELLMLKEYESQGMSIEEQAKLIRDWLENPYIVRRSVYPRISERAAEVGRQHEIAPATDAIIVATALCEGVQVLHTFDGLDEGATTRKRNKLCTYDGKIGTPALHIGPPDASRGTIFEKKRC
jgi:predicted nucleic acid-binding protein